MLTVCLYITSIEIAFVPSAIPLSTTSNQPRTGNIYSGLKKPPVLPVAVWRKSRDGVGNNFVFIS